MSSLAVHSTDHFADHEKECLWLTDYIYVATLYTAQPRLFWCMSLYSLSSWKRLCVQHATTNLWGWNSIVLLKKASVPIMCAWIQVVDIIYSVGNFTKKVHCRIWRERNINWNKYVWKARIPLISNKRGALRQIPCLELQRGFVTIYSACNCGMDVAYHIAPYSTKFTQSQHIYTTVTGSPAITGSLWMVTDGEPGLISKYSDMPLTLQCLQVFFTKLWEIDGCYQT